MILQNKRLCFLLCFDSPYGGNLIPALVTIARRLTQSYRMHVSWVFPQQERREWLETLKTEFEVRFTISYGRKGVRELIAIFQELRPDIVHTHFEKYDIPVAQALQRLNSPAHMVWHIHDSVLLDTSGTRFPILRKAKRYIQYIRQYGHYARRAYLVPVSKEAGLLASSFREGKIPFHPSTDAQVIESTALPHRCHPLLNGMVLGRLPGYESNEAYVDNEGKYVFLSFGGRERQKRLEFIVRAALILRERGQQNFCLLFTNGIGTETMLHRLLGNTLPEWVELVKEGEDVASLFRRSTCYISSADHETMSMAIAEATLYGLPVIQSDIPGTYWNAHNPSVSLFRKRNAADLAEKMERLINTDIKELRNCTETTRANNLHLLSLDKWCDELEAIYKEV